MGGYMVHRHDELLHVCSQLPQMASYKIKAHICEDCWASCIQIDYMHVYRWIP